MAKKYVFSAELDVDSFKKGEQAIEQGSERIVSAAGRVKLAFRQFHQGDVQGGLYNIAGAAGQVGNTFAHVGRMAFDAGRKIVGALEGGLSILKQYVGMGTLVAGILGGVATKLTILDSAKFESEVGRAAIQSGADSTQRRRLMQAAMAVGIETPFGPLEAARAEKVEGQRGRNPEEIIALLNATKKFAVIADEALPAAAEALSQVMFQFGVPMEQATQTALKLANATTATALSGNEMFQAMQFAGSAAGVFKVNLTEVLAVLGTLRRSMDVSTASTALKNLMLFSSALDTKSPKRLQALGITEEEAHSFDFMTGKAKSLLQVIRDIAETTKDRPELAEKIFGTRSTLAFLATLQQTPQFYTDLMARIDDTARAQEQYNQTISLADNIYRRLETTAGAVLMAIGAKIRQVFSIDEGANAIGNRLAELSQVINAMPAENVNRIVDSLGAGLIHAFGTALSFLVESLIPIGLLFGDVIFRGIKAGIQNLTASDEFVAAKSRFMEMSPEQRAQEAARLAAIEGQGAFGPGTLSEAQRREIDAFHGGFYADQKQQAVTNRRQIEALTDVLNQGPELDSVARYAISSIKSAMDRAVLSMRTNPTVRAVDEGLARGRELFGAPAALPSPEGFEPPSGGVDEGGLAGGVRNHGVMNIYGGFSSPTERAMPSREAGATPQERAFR